MSFRYLAVATEAVVRAGRLQRERYASGVAVEFKGEIDLVTEVDRACELAILETIRASETPFQVTADEWLDLVRKGVSPNVLKALRGKLATARPPETRPSKIARAICETTVS